MHEIRWFSSFLTYVHIHLSTFLIFPKCTYISSKICILKRLIRVQFGILFYLFRLHEGIRRWQKRRSRRRRMPECSSPLGWQTSVQRIPEHYHSMPNPSDDALYRCPNFPKVHHYFLLSHFCWHPLRFAGIFDETPKAKASQLQRKRKGVAAFIFGLYPPSPPLASLRVSTPREPKVFFKLFQASVFLQFWECDTLKCGIHTTEKTKGKSIESIERKKMQIQGLRILNTTLKNCRVVLLLFCKKKLLLNLKWMYLT